MFQCLDGAVTWQSVFGQTGLSNLGVRALAVDEVLRTLYAGTDNGVAELNSYALPTSAVEPGISGGLALAVWPNPAFTSILHLAFTLPRAGHVRLAIYDLAGQRVRVLADRLVGAGAHAETWDGLDARGRALAAGVYFARIESAHGAQAKRVTLLGN